LSTLGRSPWWTVTSGGHDTIRRLRYGKAIIFVADSLDGFIAADDDAVRPLFDWYGNGDVDVTWRSPPRSSWGGPRAGLLVLAASPAVLLALGFDVWAQRRGDPT
jgi:hypothetical protein